MPKWMMEEMGNLRALMMTLKPLLVEPRRSIIKILSEGVKGTNEIYGTLKGFGFEMPRSTLYYHLSALEDAGIIEVAGYREEGGGAPEKLWKLKVRKIGIDLVTGEVFKE
ncbi:helix-turn-helix domain-containing protein [Thermococcus waiotapuensis]|uniref:Helix-turn-helix domain-containing protein n=1 Tax=Thermococcus waiotapuensis TaxID=90909 RepID=A0AAE4NUE6_9EURY|nr:helix-turn-helix domain-containing protein [Thermococcus waiotapuensis]MDV3103512.1 helix-turn-helix domain-containing protein [Thermococcus waiotapuensis]